MTDMRDHEPSIWKGMVAGLAGGLVASWTMNQFQAAWTRIAEGAVKPHGAQSMKPSDGSQGEQGQDSQNDENATVKAARAISKEVFGHDLQESEKEPAGAAVHYAFGTLSGGMYGALAEVTPQVTTAAGLPFGAGFWLLADEISVPLLGLAKPPTEYPVSTHVYALASHLVYGVTAEMSRRALRHIM